MAEEIGLVLMYLLLGLFFFRLWRVHREFTVVLGQVSELVTKDIKYHRHWVWRYDALREISFEAMIFKFWKPLKSFYKDHRCLKEQRS